MGLETSKVLRGTPTITAITSGSGNTKAFVISPIQIRPKAAIRTPCQDRTVPSQQGG